MTHIRFLNDTPKPFDAYVKAFPVSPRYEALMKELDVYQESFFANDVEILKKQILDFFEEQNDSPFPVIAHVMPPQDLSDAIPFIQMMKEIPNTVYIDHQIHHIQSNRIILFHHTPPPSDIPRVLIFRKCFDYQQLYHKMVQQVLCLLFDHGISPDSTIIGFMDSIITDRYPSFTFLFTVIRQSIFEYMYNKNDEELSAIFDYNDFSLLKEIHTAPLVPITMIIKLRADCLRLCSELFANEDLCPYIFQDAKDYSYFFEGELFEQLKKRLVQRGDDYISEMLSKYGGRIAELPTPPMEGEGAIKKKSRRQRMMEATEQELQKQERQTDTSLTHSFVCLMRRIFRPLDPGCPNFMPVIENAAFNPRRSLNRALEDDNNLSDTAIAYRILDENGKTIGAAEWMRAFQAKLDIEDKAVALARFQVAVSELEYLGYTDQRSRKNGGFRHLLRV